jgi:hypothetical protein
LLAVLGTVLLVAGCGGGSSDSAAAAEKIPGVVIERAPGRSHRAGHIDYPGPQPPSGGDHNPVWLTCGFYSTPQPVENAVHDLEHGAVWVAYAPTTSPADIAVIRQLATKSHVLATPLDGLAAPVVLVAWERRLNVDSIGDPKVQQFIDAFSTGATAPERGSTCSGGIGTPG